MKNFFKILALVIALGLLLGVCWFANALMGNPISKLLADKAAQKHLTQQYPGTDYYIERVGFNFKNPDYFAIIRSPSSVDTQFTIYIDYWGNMTYDTYADVLSGAITAQRLQEEYRQITKQLLESPAFPYPPAIGYGILDIHRREDINDPKLYDIPDHSLVQEDLILDHQYDIKDLGAQAGRLIFYVDSDTLSFEQAAELLRTLREEFDKANIPFRTVDFMLQYPLPEEGPRTDGEIWVENFPYEAIYEEGLVDRIKIADQQRRAYYEALDAAGIK